MNYFYEFNHALHDRSTTCYPDESGVIKPLIESADQISILEWEIIDELCNYFKTLLEGENWSLYFKYPTSASGNKYVFFVLLALMDRSDDHQEKRTRILKETNRLLKDKYTFIDRVLVKILTKEDLEASGNLQFLVKVIYYRVVGIDFESMFDDFRIGEDSARFLPSVASKVEEFKKAVRSPQGINAQHVIFLIKILIRSAFELAEEKEAFFTRDLKQCCDSFTRHYPLYANQANQLLTYIGKTSFRMEHFLALVNDFEQILTTEYKKNSSGNFVGDENN